MYLEQAPLNIWPFRRTVEQKSLTEPTDTELAIFCGSTGTNVNPIYNTAFAMGCRLLGEGAGGLDVNLVTRGDKPQKITDHPALHIVQVEANPWTSAFEFKRDLLIATILTNRGVAWVNKVDDRPVEAIQYEPGRLDVQTASDGSGERSYRLNNQPIDASNIIHVLSPFSIAPAKLAQSAINTAANLEKHISGLAERGARPGGAIEFPGALGDDGLKRMSAGWKAAFGGAENAGRTAILWSGAKYTPFTMTSTDGQFIENRLFQIGEVARALNMSPTMLGDLTKSSYANAAQKQLEFLIYALDPWLSAMEAAFDRALLTDQERRTMRFKFDRDDLTRASLTERATAINSLIASETINPNEGRDWLGLQSYEGGDKFENRNITTPEPGVQS